MVTKVDGSRPVALVTGASEGIGRVIATTLAGHGYRVAAAARSTARLVELSADLDVVPITLDVTDPEAVAVAVAMVESAVGPIDLLVNNAGVGGHSGPTWEYDPDEWWQIMEVNVRGTFLCSHAVLGSMVARRSGRIVNLSSGAAAFEIPSDFDALINSSYMASKAAVSRFTEALAAEARSSGVTAFAISPGMVKTNMTRVAFEDDAEDDELWSPPELAAELIALIGSGALDEHSGRYIHVELDDWRSMATS